jgi:hypothetical protein
VSLGSTVVWHAARSIKSHGASLALDAGKQVRLTTTWNGRNNQGGPKQLAPGVYTVTASEGGTTASTVIQIVG